LVHEPSFILGFVIPLTEVVTAKAGPGFIAPDGGAINGVINGAITETKQ